MSNNPTSPLLGGSDREEDRSKQAQNGQAANDNSSKKSPKQSKYSDETTPLLSRDPDREDEDAGEDPAATDFASVASVHGESVKKGRTRWKAPTILAICVLLILLVAIMIFGFAIPSVIEEYAEEAVVFEPTDLSIDSITTSGVKARVKGDFMLDGSRVQKKPVRDLGRFGTWIAGAIKATPSNTQVYLPERDNAVLGSADIPSLVVSIRDGEVTHLDFVTEASPGDSDGDFDGLRQIAKDWMDGRLSELRIAGKADVALKSGIFSLGTHSISKDLVFKGWY